jgi:hypothetical protein
MIMEKMQGVLDKIPGEFIDDGCSKAPDSIFGYDLSEACRIHDFRYCTRCHEPGTMSLKAQKEADRELRKNLSGLLPWRWRWIKWGYYAAVWRYGGFGSWDSCGFSVGPRCRHNMSPQQWMQDLDNDC